MIIDLENNINENIALDLEFLNLQTGEFEDLVFWCNTETNEFKRRLKSDKDGEFIARNKDGSFKFELVKNKFLLIYKGE